MAKRIDVKLIFFILFLAAHIALVWSLPYFPSQDGPSHNYNLVILHDLINGGKIWGDFFTYQLRAVPNLGFNIVAYPMLAFFPPLVVEKIFVSVYILLLALSIPIFLRAFDRPIFPFSYFVFPVIFNYTLFMGFYSYVIAIPLFLIGVSFAWRIRDRSPAYRFVGLNLIGFLIYYAHLIPFVLFLMFLFTSAIVETKGVRRKFLEICHLCILISPCIIVVFTYLIRGGRSKSGYTELYTWKRLVELTENLFFFSTTNFSPIQVVPASLVTLLFLFFFAVYLKYRLKEVIHIGSGATHFPPAEKSLLLMALVLVMIYLAAPFRFGGGSYFNQRFPWVIFLVMLPLLRIPEEVVSCRFASILVAGAASLSLAFNALVMRQQIDTIADFLRGLDINLPKHSLVMAYKTKFPQWSGIDVLMHGASYYCIKNGCVDVGNYEAGLSYFPVSYKGTLPSLPSSDQITYEAQTIDWRRYPGIRFLIGWDIPDSEKSDLSKYYKIIREEGLLTIWQRNVLVPGILSQSKWEDRSFCVPIMFAQGN